MDNDIIININDFDSAAYFKFLISVAKADGVVVEKEKEFIELQAKLLSEDISGYWEDDLSFEEIDTTNLSRMTRIAILRDCIVLAHIDNEYTESEHAKVLEIAARLGLSETDVMAVRKWLEEYWNVIKKGILLMKS